MPSNYTQFIFSYRKLTKVPTTIYSNIDEFVLSGRHIPLWVAGGAQLSSRMLKYNSAVLVPLCAVLGGNGRPKGAPLEFAKFQFDTEIDKWRQDRHHDPLKISPGIGFEQQCKIN